MMIIFLFIEYRVSLTISISICYIVTIYNSLYNEHLHSLYILNMTQLREIDVEWNRKGRRLYLAESLRDVSTREQRPFED